MSMEADITAPVILNSSFGPFINRLGDNVTKIPTSDSTI